MPSSIPAIALTYDGTDLENADLGLFLEIVRGLNEPPRVRGVDTLVPAGSFRIPRNRVADELVIELRGWVLGNGADIATQQGDYRDTIESLRDPTTGLFRTTRDPATLQATLENGTVASISCRPTSLVVVERVQSLVAAVSVKLYAYEDWTSGS